MHRRRLLRNGVVAATGSAFPVLTTLAVDDENTVTDDEVVSASSVDGVVATELTVADEERVSQDEVVPVIRVDRVVAADLRRARGDRRRSGPSSSRVAAPSSPKMMSLQ